MPLTAKSAPVHHNWTWSVNRGVESQVWRTAAGVECVCVCEQLKATESTHTSRYTHTSAALKDCGTPVCNNIQDLGLTTEQRISEVMGHILLCVCVCV